MLVYQEVFVLDYHGLSMIGITMKTNHSLCDSVIFLWSKAISYREKTVSITVAHIFAVCVSGKSARELSEILEVSHCKQLATAKLVADSSMQGLYLLTKLKTMKVNVGK